MVGERHRQHDKIELIASARTTRSAAVMEAQGSWLTNKYAEGLPGKRYYGGCEFVDIAETLAQRARPGALPRRRARQRPAALRRPGQHGRLLQRASSPGDRILGHEARPGRPPHPRDEAQLLAAACTRSTPTASAQDTERIDYDALEAQAAEVRPKLIVAGASAYPRIFDFERMAAIAHGVGALLFVDMAHIAGLVAAGVHPSPFPHADIVTTTTHKTLRGPRGGLIFSRHELPPAVDPADFPNVKASRTTPRRDDRQDRLPGRPGRAADARDRRQGGRASSSPLGEEFRRDQRRTIENAATLAETLAERGAPASSPAAPTTT